MGRKSKREIASKRPRAWWRGSGYFRREVLRGRAEEHAAGERENQKILENLNKRPHLQGYKGGLETPKIEKKKSPE